ncbi:porin family protein [Flavobacterium sp. RHBU_3]|uniref:porin family protein n=1 Tax=Flavobacterium sp. RHBU_3 TaxID=3391184 RepID=UPI003984D3D1
MKKVFILLGAIFTALPAFSQGRGNIEASLNIGYNSSSVDSDYYGMSGFRSGFNAAAGLDFYINHTWSIKVKGIYDRKGFNDVLFTDYYGNTYATNIQMDYVTIPVLATVHFGPSKNWYIHAGPYVGFLTNAKDARYNVDVKQDFNSTDAGAAFGLGVKVPVSNMVRLFFEYDGQAGFAEVYKQPYDGYNTTVRSSFNFGVNFLVK